MPNVHRNHKTYQGLVIPVTVSRVLNVYTHTQKKTYWGRGEKGKGSWRFAFMLLNVHGGEMAY